MRRKKRDRTEGAVKILLLILLSQVFRRSCSFHEEARDEGREDQKTGSPLSPLPLTWAASSNSHSFLKTILVCESLSGLFDSSLLPSTKTRFYWTRQPLIFLQCHKRHWFCFRILCFPNRSAISFSVSWVAITRSLKADSFLLVLPKQENNIINKTWKQSTSCLSKRGMTWWVSWWAIVCWLLIYFITLFLTSLFRSSLQTFACEKQMILVKAKSQWQSLKSWQTEWSVGRFQSFHLTKQWTMKIGT